MNCLLQVEDVVSFQVSDTGSMRDNYTGGWLGVVRPRLSWKTQLVKPAAEVEPAGNRPGRLEE